jgi:hypothetical protein
MSKILLLMMKKIFLSIKRNLINDFECLDADSGALALEILEKKNHFSKLLVILKCQR